MEHVFVIRVGQKVLIFHKRFSFVDNEQKFETLPCDQHDATIQILYILSMVIIVLVNLPHIFLIKKRSQFKRLFPFLIANLLAFIGLLYKLRNLHNPEVAYAIDVFFTLVFLSSISGGGLACLVFIQKYIKWESAMIRTEEKKNKTILRRFSYAQKVCAFIIFLAAILSVMTLFIDDKKFAFPIAFSSHILMLFTVLYIIYTADYFIKRVVQSLKHSFEKDINKERRLEAEKYIKNMTVLKTSFLIQLSFLGFANLMAVSNYQGMNNWKYVIPMHQIFSCIVALVIFFVYNERKIVKFVYGIKGRSGNKNTQSGDDNQYHYSSGEKNQVAVDPDYEFLGPSVRSTLTGARRHLQHSS
eukprot:snap_masked-scaffold_10-processed-gene-10.28-mRNA-1 protein AED:1.00 eAED:1.00 QI:0/0/0/0/1/1/2/0/356